MIIAESAHLGLAVVMSRAAAFNLWGAAAAQAGGGAEFGPVLIESHEVLAKIWVDAPWTGGKR